MNDSQRLSSKVGKFRPSVAHELRRLADDRRLAGLTVYDFGLGESRGSLDPRIREAGEAAFRDEPSMDADPAGLSELSDAVLASLGLERDYGVDNVVITAGAEQSLFGILMALCDPGDVVLSDAAPWFRYERLAHMVHATPVRVMALSGDAHDMKITPEDLRRNLRMRPHARLFLLNNPVDPTAQLYGSDEVRELLQVCVEHRIYFVLDRRQWQLLFDDGGYPELPVDEASRPWIIQVDGLCESTRQLGGLGIGWAIAHSDVARAVTELLSGYTAGPATPTQRVALTALVDSDAATVAEELQVARDLFLKGSKGTPHTRIWPTPATCFSFWDVRACFGLRTPDGKAIRDSDDLAAYLAQEAGVVTASGGALMCDGYLRLCFATTDVALVQGTRAIKRALGDLESEPIPA